MYLNVIAVSPHGVVSALGGVCPLVDLHHLTDVAMMNVLQLEAFPHVEGPLIPEVLPLAIQMLSVSSCTGSGYCVCAQKIHLC